MAETKERKNAQQTIAKMIDWQAKLLTHCSHVSWMFSIAVFFSYIITQRFYLIRCRHGVNSDHLVQSTPFIDDEAAFEACLSFTSSW